MAFGDVAADGTLSASKNLQVVSHNGGLYCLKLLSGTPLNVQATIDTVGADPRSAFVAGTTNASAVSGVCPAGSQIEMATGDVGNPASSGDFQNKAFFISIN